MSIEKKIDELVHAQQAASDRATAELKSQADRHKDRLARWDQVCSEVYEPTMGAAAKRLIHHGHTAEVKRTPIGRKDITSPELKIVINAKYSITYSFNGTKDVVGRAGREHGSVPLPDNRAEFEKILGEDLAQIFPPVA